MSSVVLKSYVDEYLPKLQEALRKILNEVKLRYKIVEELYDHVEEFIFRGGKRLRPISLVAAYYSVGGAEVEDLYRVATCVELLHNASLIHDDIIDRDTIRRGGPTFHVKYATIFRDRYSARDYEHMGLSFGIIGGDLLIALGMYAITSSKFRDDQKARALESYMRAFKCIVEGECLDITYPYVHDVSEEDYYRMIDLKTGALFVESLTIGAILGDATERQITALRRYGTYAARAFQIHDDVLGIFGEEKEIGKPIGSDIREGRKNLLVIKALELFNEGARARLLKALGNPQLTKEEVLEIRDLMKERGVLDYALAKEREYVEKAIESLTLADPPLRSREVEFFKELAKYFIERRK